MCQDYKKGYFRFITCILFIYIDIDTWIADGVRMNNFLKKTHENTLNEIFVSYLCSGHYKSMKCEWKTPYMKTPHMKISHFYNIRYLSIRCCKIDNFEKHTLLRWNFLDFKRKIRYLSIRQKYFNNFAEHVRNEVGWQK
jgi:hypothetical protein